MPQVILVLGVVGAVALLTLAGRLDAWTAVAVVGSSTLVAAVCSRILDAGRMPRVLAVSEDHQGRLVRLFPRDAETRGDGPA